MPTDDLAQSFYAYYAERPDGALRIIVSFGDHSFALSPEQAEALEGLLHAATQLAVEQVAREVDRFA